MPRDGLDVKRLAGRLLRCLLLPGRFRNAVVGDDNHLGGVVLGVIARLREPGGRGRARRGRSHRLLRLPLSLNRMHGARWLCPAAGRRDGFSKAPRRTPLVRTTPCRERGGVAFFGGLRTPKKNRYAAHTLVFSRVASPCPTSLILRLVGIALGRMLTSQEIALGPVEIADRVGAGHRWEDWG